jgi:hypothetical protein
MKVPISEFRKHLFQHVDKALNGDVVFRTQFVDDLLWGQERPGWFGQ